MDEKSITKQYLNQMKEEIVEIKILLFIESH
jgi:hypothetical protein